MKERMLKLPYLLLLSSLLVLGLAIAASAQAGAKKPLSPRGSATVTLIGKKITVDYGRPYRKGRTIMGGLVPYGTVWRTGANAATGFVTEADLTVGGVDVPKGSYTLYSMPADTDWKLIINKQTGQWGTEYDQSKDLARVSMKTDTVGPTEQFTISFEKKSENTAIMHFDWERKRLSVEIKVK